MTYVVSGGGIGVGANGMNVARIPMLRSLKLSWGLGVLGPLTVIYLIGTQALAYLTDIAGIAPAIAGSIFFLVKIVDWLTDLAVGVLSDRTDTRWGRRRPWMLVGAFLTTIACALLFRVSLLPPDYRVTAAAAILLLFYTGYSMATIPQFAMLAEMTEDYQERTSLTGYSYFFGMLASALGVSAAPALLQRFGGGSFGYETMGLVMAMIPLVAGLASVRGTRTAPLVRRLPRARIDVRESLRTLAENRPLIVLIATKALATFGVACVSTAMIYFTLYVARLGQSGMVLYGVCVLAGNIVGLGTALVLAPRCTKHLLLAVALIELGCAVLSFSLRTSAISDDRSLFCLRCVLFGIGQAIVLMMLQSMMADVIQWDQLRSGKRREGALSSVVSVVQKSAPAFSALLVGFLLSSGGYIGGKSPSQQPRGAIQGIGLAVSVVPGTMLLLAALPLLFFYDLTPAKLAAAGPRDIPDLEASKERSRNER